MRDGDKSFIELRSNSPIIARGHPLRPADRFILVRPAFPVTAGQLPGHALLPHGGGELGACLRARVAFDWSRTVKGRIASTKQR
jgi:hypothetical protein